jgi:hypothetical protein
MSEGFIYLASRVGKVCVWYIERGGSEEEGQGSLVSGLVNVDG